MSELPYGVDVRKLEEFSAVDLYQMLKMRVDVFVVEQACPYPELDGKDVDCLHLRLLADGALLASARLIAPSTETRPRIGRVVVSPVHRGKRLGEALMREAVSECERRFPGQPIQLSAQAHLQAFYSRLGFATISAPYLVDNIPHIDMERTAD